MFLIWNQCDQTKKIDIKRLILCDILINFVQKYGEISVRPNDPQIFFRILIMTPLPLRKI